MLIRAALAAVLMLAGQAAFADVIAPGLWRIVSRTQTGGVIGPPHKSSRCLSADETRDVVTTFTPVPDAENTCAPVESTLQGRKLTWRLVCKGQLAMEQTGEFNFHTLYNYTATMRTRATMGGRTLVDAQDTIEARWVSECR